MKIPKPGEKVTLVAEGHTYQATVSGVREGDERNALDLRYTDDAYVDPAPDPLPEGYQAPEPRSEILNRVNVPHADSAKSGEPRWRVLDAPKAEKAPVSPAGEP